MAKRLRHFVKVGYSYDIRMKPSDLKDFGIDENNLKNYEVDISDIVIKKIESPSLSEKSKKSKRR